MIANASAMLKSRPAESWSTPDGAFYSTGPKSGKTALLFPGQGSQYTGMLRDLACAFPQMSAALTAADKGFAFPDNSRLSDRIYPVSDFSEGAATARRSGSALPMLPSRRSALSASELSGFWNHSAFQLMRQQGTVMAN